jgi:hypothetical protein
MTSPFPHPWWTAFSLQGPPPRCLDEWLIIDISNSIRSKPSWKSKLHDPTISAKWKSETKELIVGKTKYPNEIIDYVFQELDWYIETESKLEGFTIGCDLMITSSDTSVLEILRQKLCSQVSSFATSMPKDFHPNSNDQVVDIVHPSLFPLQYNITPVRTDSGLAVAKFTDEIGNFKKRVESYGISRNFQWLPSLLRYNSDACRYEFASYINNLHPKNTDLISLILEVFNAAIPGLNYVLSAFGSTAYSRVDVPDGWKAFDPKYEELVDALDYEDSMYDEKYEALEETKIDYLLPIVPKFTDGPKFDKEVDLAKDFPRLKVIVKLADIELTPEKPSYAGGSWHVEGTINEDIVATVLYYYDVENITESRLLFRTGFEEFNYEQNDALYGKEIFGISDGDSMVKTLGSVVAKKDRMVIFPNGYQHHVDSFELQDKSKPGFRKILCMFLVDPHNDLVVTTETVSPQQESWWTDNLVEDAEKAEIRKLGDKYPMTLETAKTVREELMKERSANTVEANEDEMGAFGREFSLCEH